MTIKISSSSPSSSPSQPTPSSSSSSSEKSSTLPSSLSSSVVEQSNKKEKRRFRRTKQKMEYELTEIFRRLCNGDSDLQIMTTLNLQERNYYKYKKKLENRLMKYQLRKSDDTLFLECSLFKNRMLNLYKALETKVLDDKTSGVEKARCAEIAANIALDVLKMESEAIRAVKELGSVVSSSLANKNTPPLLNNNLRNDGDNDDVRPDNNSLLHNHHNDHQHEPEQEEDDNRKF